MPKSPLWMDDCLTDIVLHSWCEEGSQQTAPRRHPKGFWAVHSRHSFLSSRDMKENRFLSPPATSRILLCMCTVAPRCLYFKIIGHLCQTQRASTIPGLQLCRSPEEDRDCHSPASAARGWTALKSSPARLAALLLPWII